MALFTVVALASVAALMGVLALVVLWQVLAAVSRPTSGKTDKPDRS